MVNSIVLPKIMQVGADALNLLPDTLVSLSCRFPCIVTDKTMLELGYVAKVEALLNQQNIKFGLFSETMPEPNDTSILAAVEMVKSKQYDCLIALGGGSAIDSAKAIALLVSHGGKMSDYKVPYQVNEISLPVVAIPTTAGTGSEATRVRLFLTRQQMKKCCVWGQV
jgi:alcohol dehydrogenase class IV